MAVSGLFAWLLGGEKKSTLQRPKRWVLSWSEVLQLQFTRACSNQMVASRQNPWERVSYQLGIFGCKWQKLQPKLDSVSHAFFFFFGGRFEARWGFLLQVWLDPGIQKLSPCGSLSFIHLPWLHLGRYLFTVLRWPLATPRQYCNVLATAEERECYCSYSSWELAFINSNWVTWPHLSQSLWSQNIDFWLAKVKSHAQL